MFGYIKPSFPHLSEEEALLYKAVYCGLCKTQRKRTGLFSCFTLSYDFVFLYLFRAELTATKSVILNRKIKLIHREEHHYLEENDQLLYCAACAALLNYHKLKDNIKDESFLKALSLRALLPFFKYHLYKAEKRCPLPTNQVKEALERLASFEAEGTHSPDELAQCSGEVLSAIASYGLEEELSAFAAEKFGGIIGKWLYLVDAVDDYAEDLKKSRFSPFKKEAPRIDLLGCTLDALCNDADILLSKIPVNDKNHRALLENILYHGMHDSATNALYPKGSPERKDDRNE